ncbi:glycoside hydrolase family 3 C-terminal domain-containing protein [Gynuella sp.]|uniref:glycoside hydrolase family 3 C-terminal domain-containing protein n=1 Tax=Gynuella sp. TaxID=2969146 RepID=UPI003D10349F
MFDPVTILKQLNQEEKVRLLCGLDAWHLHGIEHLGIPSITLTDGPHGVRLAQGQGVFNSADATVFPVEAAMAATWNVGLIKGLASAIGEECQQLGVSVLLGPGVNGKRSPLGGRNFEYFSEDPYLTGAMASKFVEGVQSQGVGACLKHFAGNEQETRRFLINSVIDERTLQEMYIAPFAKAIRESRPWTVMGAYNSVNGQFSCQNSHLLQDILRDQLGFDGLVMSDWGAVGDKVACHQQGLDLEMPGPADRDQQLLNALDNGEMSEAVLDSRVLKVLELIHKSVTHKRSVQVDFERHHELAIEVACESAVLLKNCGNLPLDKSRSIGLIGQFAKHPRFQGGGSSHMTPKHLSNAFEAFCSRAEVSWAIGYEDLEVTDETLREAVALAKRVDQVVLLTGTTDALESEGFDRSNMRLPEAHIELLKAVYQANSNVVVVMYAGSAMETRQIDDYAPSLMHAWLPGEGGGEALARLLFGEVSPSGKLSETFPIRLEHNPTYESFPGNKVDTIYNEGIFTGYRYYDTKKLPVQYPFGYGLSYTSFAYSDLSYEASSREVTVNVTNIGDVAGAEVVQVYIHDEYSTLRRPDQELKGFAKVMLQPGETQRVSITLDEQAFAYFITHLQRFAEESGRFEIRVGSSSRDIHESLWIELESDIECREMPTLNDTVEDWLQDDRTRPILEEVFAQVGFTTDHSFYGLTLGFPMTLLKKFIPMMGLTEQQSEYLIDKLGLE